MKKKFWIDETENGTRYKNHRIISKDYIAIVSYKIRRKNHSLDTMPIRTKNLRTKSELS